MRARSHVAAAAFTPVTPAEPVPGDAARPGDAAGEGLGQSPGAGEQGPGRGQGTCGGPGSHQGAGTSPEHPPPTAAVSPGINKPPLGAISILLSCQAASAAGCEGSRWAPLRPPAAPRHAAGSAAAPARVQPIRGHPRSGGPVPAAPTSCRSPLYNMAGPSGRISSACAATRPRGAGGSSCQHALGSAACTQQRGGTAWGRGSAPGGPSAAPLRGCGAPGARGGSAGAWPRRSHPEKISEGEAARQAARPGGT